MKYKTISLLVPCYNEEETIPIFYAEITNLFSALSYDYEIIFVNDGSKDSTLKKMLKLVRKDARVKVVDLSRNFGKEIALTAAIDNCTGDAVIPMDVDMQDPPEVIPEMLELWEQGFEVVYAVRTSRHGDGFLKKVSASLFYRLISFTSNVGIPRNTGDFRLMDRKVIEALRSQREYHRYMKGLFAWVGFKQVGLPYTRKPRSAGKTKFNFFKLLNLAIEGITSFSTAPLRISSMMGILISVLAAVYAFYLIYIKVVFGNNAEGFTSIMIAVLFMGGIQLIAIGVVGEYVGKVFNETKQRSLYFIRNIHENKDKS